MPEAIGCPFANVRSLRGQPIALTEMVEVPDNCAACMHRGYRDAWRSGALELSHIADTDIVDAEAAHTTYAMNVIDARRRSVTELFKFRNIDESIVTLSTVYYEFDCHEH